MTLDDWMLLGTWASPLVTAAGFLLVRNQLKSDREALETQTSWEIYNAGSAIMQMFVKHPECRPYLYAQVPEPTDEPLRSRVLALIELVCDHMENIILHRGAIDGETYTVWVLYMQGLYNRSPTMRAFLARDCEGYRYSGQLLALLSDGTHAEVGTSQWIARHPQPVCPPPRHGVKRGASVTVAPQGQSPEQQA